MNKKKPSMTRAERLKAQAFKNYLEKKKKAQEERKKNLRPKPARETLQERLNKLDRLIDGLMD